MSDCQAYPHGFVENLERAIVTAKLDGRRPILDCTRLYWKEMIDEGLRRIEMNARGSSEIARLLFELSHEIGEREAFAKIRAET